MARNADPPRAPPGVSCEDSLPATLDGWGARDAELPPGNPVSTIRFQPGTELGGRYVIVDLLGKGGMGEVYRAKDKKLGGEVALKLLPSDAANPRRLRLFLGEVRVARQISHPNVCRVHDVGDVDGTLFMTMELIEGEDLAELLDRSGALPIELAAEIGGQICDGLGAVHEKGILHRDLKPANLMIDPAGGVRLTDFGLAGLVGGAAEGGTPAYMAPELFAQDAATVQSELYAIGVILYELFTGSRPFTATKAAELVRCHREKLPPPPAELRPNLPAAIGETILRCLEKEPGSRPLSTAAVAAVLRGGKAPEASGRGIRLWDWKPPELPERPYPVLLPYRHPQLLAGRDHEINELCELLKLPLPILALTAPSGVGKSSLLAGGLYPALRVAGRPAVLEHHPAEPGLTGRLINGLLEASGGIPLAGGDLAGFIARLNQAEKLAGGVPPVLILDQIEDLFRFADGRRSRAVLGTLLAATCHSQPGHSSPPCRWLLAYREEYHGQVETWLTDVIADAEREGLGGDLSSLPRDLSGQDRFRTVPLEPLATTIGAADDPLGDAAEVFLRAIRAPLELELEGGNQRYRWRFAEGAAEHLAQALAAARLAQPKAPLAPELQVVLAHLLERAAAADDQGVRCIEVPDDVDQLLDRALDDHLRRALEEAFPTARRAAQGRARALLALRQLAGASGAREGGLPAAELEQAIGAEGRKVLEILAGPATRLVVPRADPEGLCYELSHDRLAEAVARLVEEEGRHGGLVIDSELLALRRLVGLQSALHRAGEPTAATLSGPRFRLINHHQAALLLDTDRRAWWVACRRRRWAAHLRRAAIALAVMIAVGLGGLAIRGVVERHAERAAIFEQLAEGDPEVAARALTRALLGTRVDFGADFDSGELLAALTARAKPFDLLEEGLGGIAEHRRGEAVLQIAELILPLIEEVKEQRNVRLASLLWALDYAPMRDPVLADRAQALRKQALASLEAAHPAPDPESWDWVNIPAGTLWMGAALDDGGIGDDHAEELPRHQVTVSAFRMLAHEVTGAEYRRLFPDHAGDDDLPASSMSWYDATVFAAWLAGSGAATRLPTEAEWEHAARSGCEHTYCLENGDPAKIDDVAWWTGSSAGEDGENRRHPVALLRPNQHGLYDIYGNVWEWLSEWHGPYPETAQIDPVGPTAIKPAERLFRGGSAIDPAKWVHLRAATAAEGRSRVVGLRPIQLVRARD